MKPALFHPQLCLVMQCFNTFRMSLGFPGRRYFFCLIHDFDLKNWKNFQVCFLENYLDSKKHGQANLYLNGHLTTIKQDLFHESKKKFLCCTGHLPVFIKLGYLLKY
jgi:hypothetical protein